MDSGDLAVCAQTKTATISDGANPRIRRKGPFASGGWKSDMRTTLQILTLAYVGVFLFAIVNKFEPNRRLAGILKFLILVITAAAIARQLLPIAVLDRSISTEQSPQNMSSAKEQGRDFWGWRGRKP